MTTITISSRGQFVLPAAIRKRLKITTPESFSISFDESTEEITLKKIESLDEATDRINSYIKPGTPPL